MSFLGAQKELFPHYVPTHCRASSRRYLKLCPHARCRTTRRSGREKYIKDLASSGGARHSLKMATPERKQSNYSGAAARESSSQSANIELHPKRNTTTSWKCLILSVALVCLFNPILNSQQQQTGGGTRENLALATNHSHNQRQPSPHTAEHNNSRSLSPPTTGRIGTNASSTRSAGSARTSTSVNSADKPAKRNQLQAPAPAPELTARIATLDDLSHRLDQTRENVSFEMDDTRVPFWNIAHMINSIEQVDLAVG